MRRAALAVGAAEAGDRGRRPAPAQQAVDDVAFVGAGTAACVSPWTENTMEQHRIQAGLLELGVEIITSHNLSAVSDGEVEIACIYSERSRKIPAGSVVMVTSRAPVNDLYQALAADPAALEAAGIKSIRATGDCDAASTIALAVYDGHMAAREMDAPPENPDMPFRREEVSLDKAV